MRNHRPPSLRRAVLVSAFALLIFASLGFRGCPLGAVEPRPRPSPQTTTTCPAGTTPAGNGLCTSESGHSHQPAPVLCSPQVCADPARRGVCTNCPQ